MRLQPFLHAGFFLCRALMVCLVAALTNGCVSVEMFKNNLTYEPARVSSRIEARVSLDVTHTISPESRQVWQSWGNGPETIHNWELAVREVIIDDVMKSGLFASAQPDGIGEFDYLVRVRSQDLRAPDRYSAELQVCDWQTKKVLSSYKRETPVDSGKFDNFKDAIQGVMSQLKADLLADAAKGQMPTHGGAMTLPPDQTAPPVQPGPGPDAQPQI